MAKFHVADDVVKAFDELPIHMKQLADLFRKHNKKNGEVRTAIDATDIASARKVDGWKADGPLPETIKGTKKGERPPVDTYLDEDYIRKHLARIEGGATRFYRADSLDEYGPGNKGTTFIVPTSEVQDIIDKASSPEELGELLGLGKDFFVNADGSPTDVIRADFSPEDMKNLNLHMATGNEGYGDGGANPDWIPAGLLPDGNHEAVIDINDRSEGGTYKPFTFTPKE
jgi:hypothetical protein